MTFGLKAAADGLSATLQVGGVDKATLDSSGDLTLVGELTQAAKSCVRLTTANGYGSINTKVRRFTTTALSQGTDITYADSATLGASFTVNKSGVYAVSYSESFSGAEAFGVTTNATAGSTGIRSVPAAEVLCVSTTQGATGEASVSATVYLTAGTVLFARTLGALAAGAGVPATFTITRVS